MDYTPQTTPITPVPNANDTITVATQAFTGIILTDVNANPVANHLIAENDSDFMEEFIDFDGSICTSELQGTGSVADLFYESVVMCENAKDGL